MKKKQAKVNKFENAAHKYQAEAKKSQENFLLAESNEYNENQNKRKAGPYSQIFNNNLNSSPAQSIKQQGIMAY